VLPEVFTMGVKAGVDPVDLWEAVRQGATGRVRTFDRLGQRFLTGQHDPADFALRLLHKDVGLAVGLGREVGVPIRLANMAYDELTEAMNRGWAPAKQHRRPAVAGRARRYPASRRRSPAHRRDLRGRQTKVSRVRNHHSTNPGAQRCAAYLLPVITEFIARKPTKVRTIF
jgi:hypothetical protein